MKHDLDKILQAFPNFAMLQTVRQVIKKLDENKVPLDEFYEWVEAKGERVSPSPLTKQKTLPWAEIPRVKVVRKCPQCGKLLSIAPVNVTPGSQIGGDFQSQWYCDAECKGCKSKNKGCGWEEFSEKPMLEEAFPYMVKI